MNKEQGKRKTKSGIVVSVKSPKTVVVRVERTYSHPKYRKVVRSAKKYHAHYELSAECTAGDAVTIVESRPFSKLKRWRVLEA